MRHADLQKQISSLAAAADALNQASSVKAPFSLAFLTDTRRLKDPALIIEHLPAGAAVIFRDYQAPDRETLGVELAKRARANKVLFYVAGDMGLANKCYADGVHFPSFMAPGRGARVTDRLLSISCHSQEELEMAATLKADSVFLSPVFATNSHPNASYLGAERFLQLASISRMPVIALGGVTAENALTLRGRMSPGSGLSALLQQTFRTKPLENIDK